MNARGVFITGTDTGIGKTEIACGLIRSLADLGLRVAGMKPVAAGARKHSTGLRNADVEALIGAGNVRAARRLVNPYCFAPAIAPHIAAREAGVAIEPQVILRAYRSLAARADAVVVEGVGGFRVPLDARHDTGDLAQQLRLPVILVVGIRLGCISHTLLTAEAIARRGLRMIGWVANRVDPAMPRARANVQALSERLAAPLLGEIAYHGRARARRLAVTHALPAARIAALIGVCAKSRKGRLRSA